MPVLLIWFTFAETTLVFPHGLFHFLRLAKVCSDHKRGDCPTLVSSNGWKRGMGMWYALGLRLTSSFYIWVHILAMLFFKNTSPASCWSIFEIQGSLRDFIVEFWGLFLGDVTLSSKCWVWFCNMLHVLLYQILKIFAWSIIYYIDLGFKETSA